MRKAIYAGSFDPPTKGHEWMIKESMHIFPKLIVAIGINPDKKCTFPVLDRIKMLKEIISDCQIYRRMNCDVKIMTFDNEYLVDFWRQQNCSHIIRGIRSATDYEYEKAMSYVNQDICDSIIKPTTLFLIPPKNLSEVSSSMVKSLIGPHRWESVIEQYLPSGVTPIVVKHFKGKEKEK